MFTRQMWKSFDLMYVYALYNDISALPIDMDAFCFKLYLSK